MGFRGSMNTLKLYVESVHSLGKEVFIRFLGTMNLQKEHKNPGWRGKNTAKEKRNSMSNREKDSVISILQESLCIYIKKVKDLKRPPRICIRIVFKP